MRSVTETHGVFFGLCRPICVTVGNYELNFFNQNSKNNELKGVELWHMISIKLIKNEVDNYENLITVYYVTLTLLPLA